MSTLAFAVLSACIILLAAIKTKDHDEDDGVL